MKAITIRRLASALLACVFVFSAFMAGTLAWTSLGQSALNEAQGSGQKSFPVRLLKLDKDTRQPIAGAEFYLYTSDDEQIGGRHLTNAEGEIEVRLPPGSYYFLETNPGSGYTYDVDGHGESITRYPFTITGSETEPVIVRAYNIRITGSLIIEKTVAGTDKLDDEFEFTVTFSDNGTYTYRVDTGEEQTLASGGTLRLTHGQKAIFTGIPTGVVYTVVETPAPGYTTQSANHQGTITESGRTASFTNTAIPGSITVTKTVTGNGADLTKPFAFTAVIGGIAHIFTLAHGESRTFDNLPIGTPYTMIESAAEGYIATPSAGYTGAVTGNHALPFVNIRDDGTDEPGSLRVSKNVTGEGADLTKQFEFSVTIGDETETIHLRHSEHRLFENIPAGTSFTVREVMDSDYTTSINIAGGVIVANEISGVIASDDMTSIAFVNAKIPAPGEAQITVRKIMEGDYPDDDLLFHFILEIQGQAAREFTLAPGASRTFAVPEGAAYVITEVNIPAHYSLIRVENGAGTAANGIIAEFTNRYDGPWNIDISGEKTWVHGGHEVTLPAQITLRLKNGSTVVETVTVTPDAQGQWLYTFTDIPKYDGQGNEIAYTIEEAPINGWRTSYDGFDVTNTYVPPAVLDSIPVEKRITGGTNPLGGEPATQTQFQFTLTGLEGAPMPANHSITISGAGTASFGPITYHNPGTFVYTITEIDTGADGYTYDTSIYTLTVIVAEQNNALAIASRTLTKNGNAAEHAVFVNEYNPNLTSVRVSKQWAGGGSHPQSVQVQLYRNGTAHGGPVTLNSANNWTHQWPELDRSAAWTVDEPNVPAGYTKSISGDVVNGFTITNTRGTQPEFTSVSVRKAWSDGNSPSRPASVAIQLYKDGQAHGSAITLSAANSWEYTWPNLEIGPAWTVDEPNVPAGYTKAITGNATDGFVITNTRTTPPGQVIVSGTKTWIHGENPESDRPEFIVLLVRADGEIILQKRVDAADNWSWSLRFPKYDGAREIVYTVDELPVENYVKTIDGFNITNTFRPPGEPPRTSVSVRKEWAGGTPQGDHILVQLYRSGVPHGNAVKLNAGNQWRHTWQGLDPNGPWTVDEFDVPEGYAKAITGNPMDGFVITNTRDPNAPERTRITGSKTWVHGNNPIEKQPKFIDLRIFANGRFILQKRITAAEHWSWSLRMDKHDKDGREIVYTVDEARIYDYLKTIDGHNITNTYAPGFHTDMPHPPGFDPNRPNITPPKTDDESNLALWLTLMGLSLTGLTALIILARRRKKREKALSHFTYDHFGL